MPNLIAKRRVTMTRNVPGFQHQAVDRVPLGILDAYVADAKTRWDSVEVSEETIFKEE